MDELKRHLVTRVVSSSEEIRFKAQTRDEPDLTLKEKEAIVAEVLDKSPSQFLYRFGLTLHLADLDYFRQFTADTDVCYHVRNLEGCLNAEKRRILTKNRRFAAVARLEAAGYFDDLEMQKRDPLLYEELVERYMTDDEKIAQQKLRDIKRSAAERADLVHPFADLLMESLIEKPTVDAFREQQRQKEADQTEETEDNDVDEETSPEPAPVIMDERARELLHHEFRSVMEERFLDGKDTQHVNYEEIDADTNLDSNAVAARDQEDRYFDEEEPSPRQMKKFRLSEKNEQEDADMSETEEYTT